MTKKTISLSFVPPSELNMQRTFQKRVLMNICGAWSKEVMAENSIIRAFIIFIFNSYFCGDQKKKRCDGRARSIYERDDKLGQGFGEETQRK